MSKTKIKKTTLTDFIEKNHDIITAFGVFAALTVYFSSTLKGSNQLLPFFSLCIVLLLGFELVLSITRYERMDIQLILFFLFSASMIWYIYEFMKSTYSNYVTTLIFIGSFAIGFIVVYKV